MTGLFNEEQLELGRTTISSKTAERWCKKVKRHHKVCPQKTDYCDFCATRHKTLRQKRTVLRRLIENGNIDGEGSELVDAQKELDTTRAELLQHKT